VTDLVRLARDWPVDDMRTHYDGCESAHGECLLMRLADEVERLRAERARMRARIETLRGMLKSAAGYLFEAGDQAGGEECLEVAGDMEPPL
jgi:hypothetical protein